MLILKLGKVRRNFILSVLMVALWCTMSGFTTKNDSEAARPKLTTISKDIIKTSNVSSDADENMLDYFIHVTGNRPFGITFNKGIMYMVTAPASGNGMLSRVTPDGKVRPFVKLEGDFCGDYMEDKSFISSGIDSDSNGNIYITLGDRLLKISPEGKVKRIAEGFSRCFDVKLDNKGNLYVADDKVDIIYKFSPSMKKSIFYKGKLTGDFILTSLAFDKKFENLYAREGEKIIKFKINPNKSQSKPVCIANNISIFNICIDNDNNIYGCTTTAIVKIDKKGKLTTLADLLIDPDGFSIGKTGFNPNFLYVTEANGIVKVKLGK